MARRWLPLIACMAAGCGGDDGNADGATAPTTVQPTQTPGTTSLTEVAETTADVPTGPTSQDPSTSTGPTPTSEPLTTTSSSSSTGGGCGACNEPNQQCVDGACETTCQGQDPDPCGPTDVCDVISGTCKPAADACVLAGPTVACGDQQCGPGTVCDGQSTCLAVSPCAVATCTSDGLCWGGSCQCERGVTCQDPAADALNGTFALDLFGLDFSDDCTAWGVTVSGGQEFVRRLLPDGTLTTWGAIGDYDLGEVRVLRHLTVPQLTLPPDDRFTSPGAPQHVEGYGEVAVTYICCPTCGDCANNPEARGVARLVEDDANMPLPIVIYAMPTQGTGPFGNTALDGGPQGLTWGNDRVLYVGNTSQNGQLETADLAAATTAPVHLFPVRVTAAAAVSPVHLLVALVDGTVHRLNTVTFDVEFVADLMAGVTSLSHDAFDGSVYASLNNLEVVRLRPFTGEVEPFAVMPAIGRVAVSPSGNLWYAPVKYLTPVPLTSWPLPASL